MSTTTETAVSTVDRTVFVKAGAEEIWCALVDPNLTERYGYGGRAEYDLHAGGSFEHHASEEMKQFGMPDVAVDGEVIEADATRRLVQTWHPRFDDEIAAEPAGRVTITIEDADPRMFPQGGVSRLTLTHELDGAPRTAAIVSGAVADAGGGWSFVLSDLKTLLETGASLGGR